MIIQDILNLIKDRRLPHSWSIRYHEYRYKHKWLDTLSKIKHTAPLKVNVNSNTELHLQICKFDINMALLALKSLLRFDSDFRVVIHDDGTLDNEDFDSISHHIFGAEFCTVAQALENISSNARAANLRLEFHKRFDLEEKFKSRIPSRVNKIFDIHTYSDSENIVYLDSDVIFRKPSQFLKDWKKNVNSIEI